MKNWGNAANCWLCLTQLNYTGLFMNSHVFLHCSAQEAPRFHGATYDSHRIWTKKKKKSCFWPCLQTETRGNLKINTPIAAHSLAALPPRISSPRALELGSMCCSCIAVVLACCEALHWEFIKILNRDTATITFTVTRRGMIQRDKNWTNRFKSKLC